MEPAVFEYAETDEMIISNSGLALVGRVLASTDLAARVDALTLSDRPRPAIAHSDVVKSMIGLLCLGKSDYDAIKQHLNDDFFPAALGCERVPSAETMRQRLGQMADPRMYGVIEGANTQVVKCHAPALTPVKTGHVPLDVDVTPLDNSKTKKEGVACTYKKVAGYAPIFAHLGAEGYVATAELRPGNQHSQKDTPAFLARAFEQARAMTQAPLLLRLDAGFDAAANIALCREKGVDYVIARNLRHEAMEDWLAEAEQSGTPFRSDDVPGVTVYTGDTQREIGGLPSRVVYQVSVCVEVDGQALLVPEIDVKTLWTSLPSDVASADDVLQLYHDHATSEQFHAEFKSELDVERLPSGSFVLNDLILRLATVAYNILRVIGQSTLSSDGISYTAGSSAYPRGNVKRRRLKTVMQALMYQAARMAKHAHRLRLTFPRWNPLRLLWRSVDQTLTEATRAAPENLVVKGGLVA